VSHATQHSLGSLRSRIASKGDRLFCILLANSPPRIGTYVALAKAIHAEGHLAVVVHPDGALPSDEELVGFEAVEFASIPFDAVPRLGGVDLFFSSEVVFDVAPPGAVTVGIFHSLPDEGLSKGRFTANFAGNLRRKPTIIRTFDYLVAAVRQRPADWNRAEYGFQGVYPAPFLQDRRPFLDVVPGGYPKLDYSRRILASSDGPSCIVYSPTSRGSRLTRVREDGEAVLSALLRAFPEWTLVFRPYPARADIEHGRTLAASFASNPRFVLDESATGVRYQRDCAVMVTDSSSSAITFALATCRPLVFVNLEAGERRWGSPPATPVKNPFGFTAESVAAMVEAVKVGITDAPRWERAILEAADKYLYNPGSASEYLAANLPRFANRASHPDWLSIERRPWRGTGDEAEAEDHLRRLRSSWSDGAGSNASATYAEIAEYLGSGSGAAGS
jgi:hypothetical protein